MADAADGKLCGEIRGGLLAGELGDDDAVDADAHRGNAVNQPQRVHIVRDIQPRAGAGFFDVHGADTEDNLRLVPHFVKQLDFPGLVKAGEHPGGVVVVKKLAAKLQVKLAVEGLNPFLDEFFLPLHIKIFVKPDFQSWFPLLKMAAAFARFVLY